MKKMTEKNLWDAFAGESQAHMKYMIFAEQAAKENLREVARLFRANSYAEQIHAHNHLRALGEIKSTAENVKVHAELYRQAKEALSQGKDLEIGPIYVCPVCGFTMEGEAPEKCPVCNTPREKFSEF